MSEYKEDTKVVLLFSKNIIITGIHATYMKALVNKFDTKYKQGFFKRNLDVYIVAPIIGKLYNRKAEPDTSVQDDTKIMAEQLNPEMNDLLFNYRLIVFLEDRKDVDIEERSNRAFRYDKNMDKRAYGDAVFNSYVLGGIEILYEKLIGDSIDNDMLVENVYTFIEECNDLFNSNINYEELIDKCQKASV